MDIVCNQLCIDRVIGQDAAYCPVLAMVQPRHGIVGMGRLGNSRGDTRFALLIGGCAVTDNGEDALCPRLLDQGVCTWDLGR